MHNFYDYNHPDTKKVGEEDAVKFKAYMNSDKELFDMSYPSHVIHYDRNMDFAKDRTFFLYLVLTMLGGSYLYKKLQCE